MPYTTIFEIPEMTTDEYDAVHADALPDGLVDSQLLHVATDLGNQLQVFEVWETKDDFERFIQGPFADVAEKYEIPDVDSTFEGDAHNVVLE